MVAITLGLFGSTANAATAGQLPFTGTFRGTVAFTSTSTVAFHGVGTATHMGITTNDGIAVITGATDSNGCIPNVNTESLTAANGDQLVIQSDDLACPAGPDSLHGTGHWIVLSGTGRFRGMDGTGTIDAHATFGPSFSPGTVTFTVTGQLSPA